MFYVKYNLIHIYILYLHSNIYQNTQYVGVKYNSKSFHETVVIGFPLHQGILIIAGQMDIQHWIFFIPYEFDARMRKSIQFLTTHVVHLLHLPQRIVVRK